MTNGMGMPMIWFFVPMVMATGMPMANATGVPMTMCTGTSTIGKHASWMPKRPPKVTQYVLILVYITSLECLRVFLSFSVHHLGQLEISPSCGLVFGKSVFVTLDA